VYCGYWESLPPTVVRRAVCRRHAHVHARAARRWARARTSSRDGIVY
jgi:hypothetical protein